MDILRVQFIEPPKDFWFVMGEYLPPPTAALQLAAYLEKKRPDDEITVLDCQAERLDWGEMEKRIEAENPHIVAVSSLATCNAFTVVRALDAAKKVAPDAFTITGGQHFTALATPSRARACYRSFFGKLPRLIRGFLSSNRFKRKTYRYMASQQLLRRLRGLI